MLLGIPYHTALIYSSIPWRLKAEQPDQVLDLLANLLTVFRMPTFFIIAGFFAAYMIARKGRVDWFRSRAIRLLVPLSFSLLAIAPICAWLSNSDATLFDHSKSFVAHLWFLPTLFWLCVIYCLLHPILNRVRLSSSQYHFVLVFLIIYGVAVDRNFAIDHGLFDLSKVFQYAPYFLLGTFVWQGREASHEILRWSIWPFFLAAISLAAFLLFGFLIFKASAVIFSSLSVLLLVQRFGNFESSLVRDFVDKSFSIYLIHVPIILYMGNFFRQFLFHSWLEFALICTATLVISYLISFCVERSNVLKFCFNGVPFWKTTPAGVAGPAAR